MFAAERKRVTWTRRCEEKLPKALSRLSYQVKDSEKFGLVTTAKPPCRDGSLCSHPSNMAAIIRAFEDAGVIFIDTGTGGGPGVRLRE